MAEKVIQFYNRTKNDDQLIHNRFVKTVNQLLLIKLLYHNDKYKNKIISFYSRQGNNK